MDRGVRGRAVGELWVCAVRYPNWVTTVSPSPGQSPWRVWPTYLSGLRSLANGRDGKRMGCVRR